MSAVKDIGGSCVKPVKSMRDLKELNPSEVSRGDRYRVDPRLLYIESGFNIRITNTPESRDQIESIKDSIRAYISRADNAKRLGTDGLLAVIPEIKVYLNDMGKLQVYDGYHRTVAILELLSEGFNIPLVHVDSRSIDDLEVRYAMLRSGLGMRHTPLEKAVEFANLADNHGQTITQMALSAGGVTMQRVEQLLLLGRADAQIHKWVLEKAITADAAIVELRKYRDDSVAAVKAIGALIEGKKSSAPVNRGRASASRSISKESQGKLVAAIGAGAQELETTLSAVKEKHGDKWETQTMSVELPAAVVAEVLARMAKEQADK